MAFFKKDVLIDNPQTLSGDTNCLGNFERIIIMCNKKVIADGKADHILYCKEEMEQARLKQPCIVQMCNAIGVKQSTLDIKEIADFLIEKRRKE